MFFISGSGTGNDVGRTCSLFVSPEEEDPEEDGRRRLSGQGERFEADRS